MEQKEINDRERSRHGFMGWRCLLWLHSWDYDRFPGWVGVGVCSRCKSVKRITKHVPSDFLGNQFSILTWDNIFRAGE
jgi:hypothetical protein